jgi:hypothetical protein
MKYGWISFPAAAIRKKPRHSSEMVNQLLFGEQVELLKKKNDLWVKIRSLHDNYVGWVTITLITETEEPNISGRPIFSAELFSNYRAGNREMIIPFGSVINAFGKSDEMFQGNTFTAGQVERSPAFLRGQALRWLNVPYLWGGRTAMGVDCSGLVQVLFRVMGIDLPRDAWQQAQAGSVIKKFRDALPGDLLFFDAKEDIVHVGILIEPGLMIHSSGKVRLDAVDKKGIINPEIKSRKLNLKLITRIF